MKSYKSINSKIIVSFLLIVIITAGICGFVVKSVFNNGSIEPIYDDNIQRDTIEIKSYDLFEQTITLEPAVIKGFVMDVDFEEKPLIGDRVILSVFDKSSGELLGSREQNTGNFFKDELVRFKFPNEIDYKGQELILTLQFAEVDFEGGLHINTVDGNLDISVIEMKSDPYYKLVVFMFSLLMAMIILVFILLFKSGDSISLEWAYLPTGIALGIIFCFLIPVMEVPDEAGHLYSAYSASNKILGISDGEDTSVSMRSEDAEFYFQTFDVDRQYMDGLYKDMLKKTENSEIVNTTYYPSSSQMYLYIPSTIGITIGRILNCSTILTYILGRLMNVLIFVAAVWYAIRKIPFAKALVIVWALIPTTLQQTASISRDSIIFALCIIVISLTMHLMYSPQKEYRRKRKLVFLIVCALILLPAKSFACMFVSMFPLMLLASRIKKLPALQKINFKDKRVFIGGIVIGILVLCAIYVVGEKAIGIMVSGMSVAGLIKLLINTAIIQGDNYVFGLLGANLGWLDVIINKYFVLPFLICLIVAAFGRKDIGQPVSIPVKLWMLIVFSGTALIPLVGMLSAWTPDAYNYIEGVQGRHFIPALVLLFLPLFSKKITIDAIVERYIVMIIAFCEVVIVTGVVLTQI